MSRSSLLNELRLYLDNVQDWALIVSTLRQDKIIWESLEELDFNSVAQDISNTEINAWSPAAISLATIEQHPSLEYLNKSPLKALSDKLNEKLNHVYQIWAQPSKLSHFNLHDLACISLYLREQYRLVGDWDFLQQKFTPNLFGVPTITTILYGLVADKFEFLHKLNQPWGYQFSPNLALHVLLSNPLAPQQTVEFALLLLRDTTPELSISFLHEINDLWPLAAQEIVRHLLHDIDNITNLSGTNRPLPKLVNSLYRAELSSIVGFNDNEITNRNSAQEANMQIMASQIAKSALLAYPITAIDLENNKYTSERKTEKLLEAVYELKKASLLDPDELAYRAAAAILMLHEGDIKGAEDLILNNFYHNNKVFNEREIDPIIAIIDKQSALPNLATDNLSQQPAILLAKTFKAYIQGEQKAAADYAEETIRVILDEDFQNSLYEPINFLPLLINLLCKFKHYQSALDASKIALNFQPNDTDLMVKTAKLYTINLQFPQAITLLQLVLSYNPDKIELRNLLIYALEASNEWESAFNERQSLISQLQQKPSVEEQHNLAYCALKAERPETALQICKNINQNQSISKTEEKTFGITYWLLGEAEIRIGNYITGLENLTFAQQYYPSLPFPWITLANFHFSQNNFKGGVEILNKAAKALPQSIEIQFTLGKYYLDKGTPSLALPHLEQAKSLLPEAHILALDEQLLNTSFPSWARKNIRLDISYYLGKTLQQLGHIERAVQLFEQVYISRLIDPACDISFYNVYAYSLLSLGLSNKAIPVLNVIVNNQKNNLDARIELAQALVENSNNPEDINFAVSLLQNIVNNPDSNNSKQGKQNLPAVTISSEKLITAKMILAESLFKIGDYSSAAQTYRMALEDPAANAPKWKARLSFGLGQAAMKLGEIETSIAAFQESIKFEPDNPKYLRKLADAYLKMGLFENSLQMAYSVYQQNPADLETASWFAEHCTTISQNCDESIPQAKSLAVQALERATSLSPSRDDLLLKRGIAYLETNQIDSAKEAFIGVSTLSDNNWKNIYRAAIYLRNLGNVEEAIQNFEKAINISKDTQLAESDINSANEDNPAVIYFELAQTYIQDSNLESALQSLERGIQACPNSIDLFTKKSEILEILGKIKSAIDTILMILKRKPNEGKLYLRASELYFANQDFVIALLHAEQAIALLSQDEDQVNLNRARLIAASISFALLQFNRSSNYLNGTIPDDADPNYCCLLAELSFLLNEENLNSSVSEILDKDVEHQNIWRDAIIIRLKAQRNGINYELNTDFGIKFVHLLNTYQEKDLFTLYALIQAALLLGKWKEAKVISNTIIEHYPDTPLAGYIYATTSIASAEAQIISNQTDIVTHSPGNNAISEQTFIDIKEKIQSIERQLQKIENDSKLQNLDTFHLSVSSGDFTSTFKHRSEAKSTVAQLSIISNALFQPNSDHSTQLKALIEANSQLNDLIGIWIYSQQDSISQTMINKISQADPPYPIIWIYLAIAQLKTDSKAAYSFAQKALSKSIHTIHNWKTEEQIIYALSAKCALLANDIPNGLRFLQKALEFWPDEPRWHSLAAYLTLQSLDPKIPKAIEHLQKAIQIEPSEPEYYLQLGELYQHNLDSKNSLQVLQKASDLFPNSAHVWVSLGNAYIINNDYELAENCAEHALTLAPKTDKDLMIQTILLQGKVALKTGKSQEAIDRAKSILLLESKEVNAFILLSHAYEVQKKPSKAIASMERAIELSNENSELEVDYLRLIHDHQGVENAIQKSIEMLERQPNNANLIATLSKMLEEAGRDEEAVEAAREALKNSKETLDLKEQAQMHWLIGHQSKKDGHLDQAIFHLSRAIKLDPKFIEPYLALGQVYSDRRESEKALTIYQKAINISPNDPRPYFQAGIIYKDHKEYIQSEAMLRKAVQLAPNDINIHRMHAATVVLNLVHNRKDINAHMGK
jgi:tetratricopeptide (TPR) repeat protein